jgi:hypothetical protein
MVNRQIGRALLEIGHGISAGPHQGDNRIICIDNSAFGVIYEARLNNAPAVGVLLPLGSIELANMKLFNSLFTFLKQGLGFPLRPALPNRAIVLWPETLAESGFAPLQYYRDDCNEHHNNRHYETDYFGIYLHAGLLKQRN